MRIWVSGVSGFARYGTEWDTGGDHPTGRSGSDEAGGSGFGWREGAFGLKTLSTEHGAALSWLEWHGGLDATLGAVGTGFGAAEAGCGGTVSGRRCGVGAFGFAGFTTFGVVFELLVEEEELFPGGEDKFAATVDAGE